MEQYKQTNLKRSLFDKTQRMKAIFDKKKRFDNHHICPKERIKDWYNVHTTENIIRLQRKFHEDIHHVFGNKVPHEKIIQIIEMDGKVINKKYVKQLFDILHANDFYIDNIILKS